MVDNLRPSSRKSPSFPRNEGLLRLVASYIAGGINTVSIM